MAATVRRHPILLLVALAAATPPSARGASFSTAPNVPTLPAVTLNGQAQTVTAQMPNWGVSDSVLGSPGWNVTVKGDSSAGHSPVFKVYCPGPGACGPDAVGYVTGGSTLPASSLTLNSTGALWTGGLLPVPSHTCNSGCKLDSATAVKVASEGAAPLGLSLGTWTASNYAANSLSLAIPTTLRVPGQAGEVYRVDLVWTLGSGP